jgi:DNA mismatch repair ATPase MutL
MNALLTKSFSVESQEGQELVNKIKTSYANQDKEAFLDSKKDVVEAGFAASSDEEKATFNDNVYKMLLQLPEGAAMAFVQVLIKERRDNVPLNDTLGDSDDIFLLLKGISKKADENEDEEIRKIKKGEAFYH